MSEPSEKHPPLIRWWMWPVLIVYIGVEAYFFTLGEDAMLYALGGITFLLIVCHARADRVIGLEEWTGCGSDLFRLLLVAPIVAIVFLLLIPAVSTTREAARANTCRNNLRNLSTAIANYDTCNAQLPPPMTVDPDGRPLHSWRTMLLPFLEAGELYDAVDFSQSWNSDSNACLSEYYHPILTCPSVPNEGHSPITNYVAVTGANTAWPEGGTPRSYKDFASTACTVLVIEYAASDIHFAEPRDIRLGDLTSGNVPWSDLGAHPASNGAFYEPTPVTNVAFADGHVTCIVGTPSPELITQFFSIDNTAPLEEMELQPSDDVPLIPRRTPFLAWRLWQACTLIMTGSLVHSLCGIAGRKRL